MSDRSQPSRSFSPSNPFVPGGGAQPNGVPPPSGPPPPLPGSQVNTLSETEVANTDPLANPSPSSQRNPGEMASPTTPHKYTSPALSASAGPSQRSNLNAPASPSLSKSSGYVPIPTVGHAGYTPMPPEVAAAPPKPDPAAQAPPPSSAFDGIKGFFGFGKPAISAEEKKQQDIQKAQEEYDKLLVQAQATDLSDLDKHQMVYVSGVDLMNRPIVVVVAQRIPAATVDLDRMLLYFVKVLDTVVAKDYVIVYVHSGFKSDNQPPINWLVRTYSLFSRKYKKNLKQLFVVQATWWVKLVLKFFRPFISAKFWKKLIYIESLSELLKFMNPGQVKLPISLNQSEKLTYFCTELDQVIKIPCNAGSPVPILVTNAIRYLYEHGLTTQGVFRLSADASRIAALKDSFNRGEVPDFNSETEVHNIAGLLKLFFRELPDPLLCYDLYDQWLAAAQAANKVESVKAVLTQLPPVNRVVLAELIRLLAAIAQNAEINKMPATNLAIVWAPNILKSANETPQSALLEMNATNALITLLIQRHRDILGD